MIPPQQLSGKLTYLGESTAAVGGLILPLLLLLLLPMTGADVAFGVGAEDGLVTETAAAGFKEGAAATMALATGFAGILGAESESESSSESDESESEELDEADEDLAPAASLSSSSSSLTVPIECSPSVRPNNLKLKLSLL